MTILSCKILQDEILHLFENDSSISKIIVVKNNEEQDFLVKMEALGLQYALLSLEQLPSCAETEKTGDFTVVICLVELALHEFPKMLKLEVYERIRQMTKYSDGILLFYGLCGNVLDKVEEDFKYQETTCPVRILRDSKRIVDDCIGATLGGGEEYLRTLKMLSEQGTFLFTPMYAHSWREIMRVDPTNPDKTIKMLKKVNEITGYKRVAKIDTGLTYTDNFHDKVEEFARIFDFGILEIEGNQEIFQACYSAMKELMGV